MNELRFITDRVTPAEGIVQRIQDRHGGRPRQRPFPPLPGEEEAEKPSEPNSERTPEPTPDDGEEHRIDVHVQGWLLPTRQAFPPADHAFALH
ncbi:MAG: hypothetical protein ACE5FG_04845 [Myxococcota bacterium]